MAVELAVAVSVGGKAVAVEVTVAASVVNRGVMAEAVAVSVGERW
ncbi:MAG: hypothetical protein R2848_11690 [Thermomicrobiales bacterium]